MALGFEPAAAEEFFRAVRFYEERAPGLGDEFIGDLDRACELVRRFPTMGSPGPAGTRRVLLGRFPISVVYMTRREGIVVVALAHQKKTPGYWRDRL